MIKSGQVAVVSDKKVLLFADGNFKKLVGEMTIPNGMSFKDFVKEKYGCKATPIRTYKVFLIE